MLHSTAFNDVYYTYDLHYRYDLLYYTHSTTILTLLLYSLYYTHSTTILIQLILISVKE